MNAGGFMPGSQNGSPSGGGGKRQSNHTHRPCTIKQLQEAYQAHPDAEFRIDDQEVEHVMLVGSIQNYAKGNTNVSCSVEDGTGTIDVRLWVENPEEDSGKLEGVDQGVYVRVVGNLKSFNNKRSVNATVIRKITDFNEISFHFLETVYVHLYTTRGPPNVGGAGRQAIRNQPQQARNGNDPYAAQASVAQTGSDWNELKPLGRKIMQHIERIGTSNLPEDGLDFRTLTRSIQGTNVQQLQAEVNSLLEDGVLYTTSDDYHILPTTI